MDIGGELEGEFADKVIDGLEFITEQVKSTEMPLSE
jgi:hypothetical protein